MVNVARTVRVSLSEPIDPATITSDSLQVFARGNRLPGRIGVGGTNEFLQFFPDNPFPASTEILVVVNGDTIRDTDGVFLDANGDGTAGGTGTFQFSTLPLTFIPDTAVSGRLLSSNERGENGEDIPIVGATIRLESRPDVFAITDENGRFTLTSPAGLPAPEFFVIIDGSTATGAPEGFMYPTLGKPFQSVPGQAIEMSMNGVPMDIFLPLMNRDDITPLNETETTNVGFGDGGRQTLAELFPDVDPSIWDRTQVSFLPGSAQNNAGTAATQAAIVPVDPNRLPGGLPDFLDPQLVISIQAGDENGFNDAGGSTNFVNPAPITFPNLDGLAPGEQTLIFSFDHEAGEWIVTGTGTVSEDGLMIESNGGVIRAPGWHTMQRGTVIDISPDPDTDEEPFDQSPWCNLIAPIYAQVVIDSVRMNGSVIQQYSDIRTTGDIVLDEHSITIQLPPGVTGDDILNSMLREGPNGFIGFDDFSSRVNFSSNSNPQVGDIYELEINPFGSTDVLDLLRYPARVVLSELSIGNGSDGHWQFTTITTPLEQIPIPFQELQIDIGLLHPSSGTREFGYRTEENGYTTIYTRSVSRASSPLFYIGENLSTDEYRADALTLQDRSWVDMMVGLGRRVEQLGGRQVSDPMLQIYRPDDDPVCAEMNLDLATLNSIDQAQPSTMSPSGEYFYRVDPLVETAPPMFGFANVSSNLRVVLPPESSGRLLVADPVSRLVGEAFVFSGGDQFVDLADISFTFLDENDFDLDGLSDTFEWVLGTSRENSDSDNDGISDGAEIEQGLNPLDGFASTTGVVASLDLGSRADALAVAGDSVYVVHGDSLTVVDASQFDLPVIQGEIVLPAAGRDVAVDAERGIAVIPTGLAVQLVDVSDPMSPTLIRSVSGFATRVELFGGFAYVTSGATLTTLDTTSGEIVSRMPLPGNGNVTGLVRIADTLFAFVSGSDTVVSIDLAEPESPQILDQLGVSIASSNVGVFADNDVLWLSGSGLRTVDISNPANLQIIQAPSSGQFFTASDLALNGSGLGMLLPSSDDFVSVYDTSDPTDVANFVTQFDLSGRARDVKISRGIGYVAAGNRLDVVNYRPFDSQGQVPTVTITTPVADIDPAEGIQVLEGTTIPIVADVFDDVQAREVELLVNNTVVGQDVSFPFDLAAIAPLLSTGTSELTIQARAIDTGGNSTLSDPILIAVVPDTVPPVIESITPLDEQSGFGGKEIQLEYRFPDAHTVFGTPLQATVGAGVEFGNPTQPASSVANVQFDISTHRIEANFSNAGSSGYADRDFNGYAFFDFNNTIPEIINVVIDSTMNSLGVLPEDIVFDGNSIQVNVAGLLFTSSTTFALDVEFADDPDNNAVIGEGTRALGIRFSESLSTNSIAPGNIRVEGAGPDAQFGTADDFVASSTNELRSDDELVQVTVDLEPGEYRLVIDETAITDRASNALGLGTQTRPFTVLEVQTRFQGENPHVVLVVDVSGSTDNSFGGTGVGDINGDGRADTILDAELASLIVLNQELVNLDLGENAQVSIITFSDAASALDMNPFVDGIQLTTNPLADADNNGRRDIEQVLASIGSGGGTDFEDALNQAISVFDQVGTPNGSGNLLFLSDGDASGDLSDEVQALLDRNISSFAIGVGTEARLSKLQEIDPSAPRVTSTDEFLDYILTLGSPTGAPASLDRVFSDHSLLDVM